MKKSTMRSLAIMIALVFCFSAIMMGCGSKTENTETTTATTTTVAAATTQAPTEAKLAPYEIKWYMPNGVQPDMAVVNAEMSKITQEKINATLNVEYVDWGSYDQKIQVKMASAEPMDL